MNGGKSHWSTILTDHRNNAGQTVFLDAWKNEKEFEFQIFAIITLASLKFPSYCTMEDTMTRDAKCDMCEVLRKILSEVPRQVVLLAKADALQAKPKDCSKTAWV